MRIYSRLRRLAFSTPLKLLKDIDQLQWEMFRVACKQTNQNPSLAYNLTPKTTARQGRDNREVEDEYEEEKEEIS